MSNRHFESSGLYLTFMSHLRIGRIVGNTVVIDPSPAIFPSDRFSQYGCEDPRAVNLDGIPYATFGAIGQYGATGWLAELSETGSVHSKHMILGPDHKHCALFPSRVGNKYILVTRPLTRSTISRESVWILCSKDLKNWGTPLPLLEPRAHMWDCVRVGPGPSPILLPSGWLLLYYGVDSDYCYHLGVALLDRSDPTQVVARSAYPILSPVLPWERNGRRADTVFSGGINLLADGATMRIYYGASDTYIGAADISISALDQALVPTRQDI